MALFFPGYISIGVQTRIVPDCFAAVLVQYRRAADLNNSNNNNNNNTGWLRENNSEMKPIWFSLFDFYTADQWSDGTGSRGEEVAEQQQQQQHAPPLAVVVGPARPARAA